MSKDYRVHPLAQLFPPMSREEYIELRDDIKQHGLREPLVLLDGKILDGRHRAKACRELRITPTTRTLNNGSPLAFVISMNVKRRHLNQSQKGMVGFDSLHLFEKEAKKRKQESGKVHGRGQIGGGKNATSYDEKHKARDDAAKSVGVSARYIQAAKVIQKESPRLASEVRDGKKTIPQAIKEILPKVPRRKPGQASGWFKAFHDLFKTCNSVRDIGGIEKLMGGWKKSDKAKIVNQINYIEEIFAEWKAYLEGGSGGGQNEEGG